MPKDRYSQCFKAPYSTTEVTMRGALRQFNRKNRRGGWIAIEAEPMTGAGTGITPVMLKVCVRPPRRRRAKWQR